MTVETIELAPGYRISRMLRGGWQLAGGHGAIEAGQPPITTPASLLGQLVRLPVELVGGLDPHRLQDPPVGHRRAGGLPRT